MPDPDRGTDPQDEGDPRRRGDEDEGLLDETAPLPAPGGEDVTPSEGPDDPPNEGDIARDPDPAHDPDADARA
jgi:hypothetical protein